MSNFKNKTITSKGLELLTSALAGQKLHFTRIVLGAGEYNGDIGMVESLVDQKQSLDIISMSRNGSQVVLTATLTQDKVIEGFYWKEIGVYAKGVDDVEVLYIYGSAKDNEFSYISKDMLNEKMINVGVLVSSAQNITAEISSSLLYLSAQDMINHNNDLKAHADIREAIENKKSTIDGNENEIVTISKDNKAKTSGIGIDTVALIDKKSLLGTKMLEDADTLNGHNAEYFLNKIAENTKQINNCLKFMGDILDLNDACEEGIYGITPQTVNNPFPNDYGKCIVFKKPDINAIHQTIFKTSGNANASMATRNSYFSAPGKLWGDWHIPVSIAQLNNALAINNLQQV